MARKIKSKKKRGKKRVKGSKIILKIAPNFQIGSLKVAKTW